MLTYKLLDIFFVLFHSSLILFNLFGWIWRKTRKANLITLLLTGASWFILGIFYGIGYCPLTDWHFMVLRELGRTDLPSSYTEYLAERISGLEFSSSLTDTATMAGFFIALVFSVTYNIMDRKRKKK